MLSPRPAMKPSSDIVGSAWRVRSRLQQFPWGGGRDLVTLAVPLHWAWHPPRVRYLSRREWRRKLAQCTRALRVSSGPATRAGEGSWCVQPAMAQVWPPSVLLAIR
jgi:hypothetical protein